MTGYSSALGTRAVDAGLVRIWDTGLGLPLTTYPSHSGDRP
jgi:hypothetical protein